MNEELTYKIVVCHGKTYYTLNLNRKYYGGRKMTDFIKETSGTLIAFHFLHSRYVKKPSSKLLLFFSSFSVNRLYSLKHEIFN